MKYIVPGTKKLQSNQTLFACPCICIHQ